MGHLDRRLDPDRSLSPAPEAGVKDGPASQTPPSPARTRAVDCGDRPAPDVVHDGTTGETQGRR
jgi:hypothetical protein